jgi:hypothetical protein
MSFQATIKNETSSLCLTYLWNEISSFVCDSSFTAVGGTEADFLQVVWFPLPILIPPAASHSLIFL